MIKTGQRIKLRAKKITLKNRFKTVLLFIVALKLNSCNKKTKTKTELK